VQKDRGVDRLSRTVSEHVNDPRHAGAVDDADRVGAVDGHSGKVSIGLWFDRMGRVQQARWIAAPSESDALAAYAEVACTLLESGVAPTTVDAGALRRTVAGVEVRDQSQADLVADAIYSALSAAD
jgi:hypothetical protein